MFFIFSIFLVVLLFFCILRLVVFGYSVVLFTLSSLFLSKPVIGFLIRTVDLPPYARQI